MKAAVLLFLLTIPVLAQTPRSGMTGHRISGAEAGKAIAIAVIPNAAISASDEIVPDGKNKEKSTIPVTVWRSRPIEGDPRLCPIVTFQFEYMPGRPLAQQVFVIEANLIREFDTIMFEGRPWYSIARSGADPAGSLLLSPAPPGWLTPVGTDHEPINCSDDPHFTLHATMFKE